MAARTVYPILHKNLTDLGFEVAIVPSKMTVSSIASVFDFTPRGLVPTWSEGPHHEATVELRAEEFCQQCHIEAEIGDRPYGVDLIIPAKYEGSDSGGKSTQDIVDAIPPEHRRFVDELLAKYEVPALPEGESGGTMTRGDDAIFSAASAAPQLDISLAHNPVLIVNALGPPTSEMIERSKESGRKVGAPRKKSTCASSPGALWNTPTARRDVFRKRRTKRFTDS